MNPIFSQMTTASVDWRTFGVWVDTEGHTSSVVARMKKNEKVGLRRDHELAIYQDEKEASETLADFLVRSGLSKPYFYLDEKTGVWSLKVYRVEDIEGIIEEIEPFILTRKKRERIERFRRFRSERYKRFLREVN